MPLGPVFLVVLGVLKVWAGVALLRRSSDGPWWKRTWTPMTGFGTQRGVAGGAAINALWIGGMMIVAAIAWAAAGGRYVPSRSQRVLGWVCN